jgi:hypothetical protein
VRTNERVKQVRTHSPMMAYEVRGAYIGQEDVAEGLTERPALHLHVKVMQQVPALLAHARRRRGKGERRGAVKINSPRGSHTSGARTCGS